MNGEEVVRHSSFIFPDYAFDKLHRKIHFILRRFLTKDSVLSTVHISPSIEAVIGASYLKVKRLTSKEKEEGEEVQEKEQGEEVSKRGAVISFSRKSRKRLIDTLARIRRDELPCFVTLTYPAVYSPNPKVWKRHLDTLMKRLSRKFPAVSGVWKLEPQKRGAPHYHVMVWGVPDYDLRRFIPQAWYEVVGSNDEKHLAWHEGLLGNGNKHCVQRVEKVRGVFWYASKYMSKEVNGWDAVGRWWGVFFRERLPVGDVVKLDVSDKKAVQFMRYMRRFAHIRSRDYRSLSIVCDVDKWLRVLLYD